jgi:hypothetical protein
MVLVAMVDPSRGLEYSQPTGEAGALAGKGRTASARDRSATMAPDKGFVVVCYDNYLMLSGCENEARAF